ncbi:hypothetical protein Vi05172_g6866 [Venturia inaequalis]|nr:hypothetical protein Vi05172_g6866 [Venturia inaequalis]
MIKALRSTSSPGLDKFPNVLLKLCRTTIVPHLEHLFNACLRLGYHPVSFKSALTIVLRKPGRTGSYRNAKNWRPIALLSCIGKLLESVFAHRLKNLAISHKLIPKSQFGFAGKSTEAATLYLTSLIRLAWERGLVVTVMGTDIESAFDRVDRAKLLHILYDRGIPDWLINCISSFLSDRTTKIAIPGFQSEFLNVLLGIPQGSPLSPILWSFFLAPLLERLEQLLETPTGSREFIFTMAYVDDTYLIAMSPTLKNNCTILEKVHEGCGEWSQEYSMKFSLEKYKIMHFLPDRHHPSAKIGMKTMKPKIPGLVGQPKTSLKILGVTYDNHLRWNDHVNSIVSKLPILRSMFGRLCNSTHGPRMVQVRQLYLSIVRPNITHTCAGWYLDEGQHAISKGLKTKLESMQTAFLRIVCGAFKHTSASVLRKESNVESILVHMKMRALKLRVKCELTDVGAMFAHSEDIILGCQPVSANPERLKKYQGWSTKFKQEASGIVQQVRNSLLPSELKNPLKVAKTIKLIVRKRAHAISTQAWKEVCAIKRQTDQFADVVVNTPRCSCRERPLQTVYHMMIECPDLAILRLQLEDQTRGRKNLRQWLTKDTAAATRWAIRVFKMQQFEWMKINMPKSLDARPKK